MTDRVLTVSAILLNRQNSVLLQLRDDNPAILWPGRWTLPGGMVEPGETPDQAIAREMLEEMGLADLSFRLWSQFDAPRGDPPILAAEHIYVARLDRDIASIPLHEGQRIAFFPQDEIAGMELAFNYTPLLAQFFASLHE